MSVTPAGPGTVMPGGMPSAIMTREALEITPELVQHVKETLVSIGLPPTCFRFTFDKDNFIFRPLYGKDWAAVQQYITSNEGRLSQEAIDQKICELGILLPDVSNPVLWEVQRAGYQSNLAKKIFQKCTAPGGTL